METWLMWQQLESGLAAFQLTSEGQYSVCFRHQKPAWRDKKSCADHRCFFSLTHMRRYFVFVKPVSERQVPKTGLLLVAESLQDLYEVSFGQLTKPNKHRLAKWSSMSL